MRYKLGFSLVLAFLAFVFITQNTETVQVRVLLWSVEMSLVLLVFIMLGAGVIIGWLLNSYMRFAGQRKQDKARQVVAPPTKTQENQPAAKAEVGQKEEQLP